MLASDGSLVWSKAYGSCGVPNQCGHTFIKNECWGLAATSDGGVVLACGTGIENCNGMSGAMRSDCDADAGTPLLADTRAGAVARSAAVWQSLIVRTDADGNLQWMRTDQYRGSDDAPLGTSGWQQSSSASEYVAKCADGGLIFVNDEAGGVGVLKLGSGGPPTPNGPPPPHLPPAPPGGYSPPPPPPPSPPSPPMPPPAEGDEESAAPLLSGGTLASVLLAGATVALSLGRY